MRKHLLFVAFIDFIASIMCLCLIATVCSWSGQFPSSQLTLGKFCIALSVIACWCSVTSALALIEASLRLWQKQRRKSLINYEGDHTKSVYTAYGNRIIFWSMQTAIILLGLFCLIFGFHLVARHQGLMFSRDSPDLLAENIFKDLWTLAGPLGRNRIQDGLNCCGLNNARVQAVDSASCPPSITTTGRSNITANTGPKGDRRQQPAAPVKPGCLERARQYNYDIQPILFGVLFAVAAVNLLVGSLLEYWLARRRLSPRAAPPPMHPAPLSYQIAYAVNGKQNRESAAAGAAIPTSVGQVIDIAAEEQV